MAQLAIKGHATRGKEVINLLEMLGANRLGYKDTFVGFYYYIECGAICSSDEYPTYSKVFTLEEFLEKYPYKVGDEVIAYAEGILASFSIKGMRWNNKLNKVEYKICSSWYDVSMLSAIQPYTDYDIKTNKEEAMEEKGTLEQIDLTRELRIADEVEVILGDYEFVLKDGKTYFVKKKPQYPKTYDECCKILGIEDRENGYCGYEYELLGEFQKLYICRNAYWKIAGEQMGLDKPWEPDFTNYDEERYGIYTLANKVERDFCGVGDVNMILSFPTEEMRDKFYDNFKDLIEQCKELL